MILQKFLTLLTSSVSYIVLIFMSECFFRSGHPSSMKLLNTLSQVLLVQFNHDLDLILACDVSSYHSYGIGWYWLTRWVMELKGPLHLLPEHWQIQSKGMPKYNGNHALTCVFGELHSYLYSHHFTLITDHKPLLALFSKHWAVPTQASSRIQCWASTTQYGNANASMP